MDSSKRNMSAVKGSAPIKKVGQTAHRNYGSDPNPRAMVKPNDSRDLNLK